MDIGFCLTPWGLTLFSLIPFICICVCSFVADYAIFVLEFFSFFALWTFVVRGVYFQWLVSFFIHTWDGHPLFEPVKQARLTFLSEVELLVLETVLVFESFFFLWSFLNRCFFVLFVVAVFIL
jgi:hypothetical protein